jgi:hypothetical protein
MMTLHYSRRLAAARELHRYHALVQDSRVLVLAARMAVSDSAPKRGTKAAAALGVQLMLLACFAMIHGFAEIRIESARYLHHSLSSDVSAVLAPGD